MRNSSKILAILLTLAVLVGALAIAAFATEEEITSPTPVIDISDANEYIKFYRGHDFEGLSFAHHWSEKIGTIPNGCGDVQTAAKNHTHFDSRENMGNTYGAFWYDKNASDAIDPTRPDSAKDTYYDVFLGSGYGNDTDSKEGNLTCNNLGADVTLITNDYIVFDWDFGADKYITATGELVDTWVEGATLSYSTNLRYLLDIRGQSTSWMYKFGDPYIKFGKDDGGKWYIYCDKSASDKAYVSEKAGELNHFTMVAEINNRIDITIDGQLKTNIKYMDAVKLAEESGLSAAEAKSYVVNNAKNYRIFDSKIHLFLNGDHFTSCNLLTDYSESMGEKSYFEYTHANLTGIAYVSPAHFFASNVRLTDGSSLTSSYSLMMDNVSTHFYKSGYQDPANTQRQLGYYISNGNYVDRNLAYCEDVVYNGNYQMPKPNTYVASVQIGDTITSYYTKQGAEDALVPNATLIIEDGTKYSDFIVTFKFKVKTNNPENFVIRNSDEYSLVPTSEENVYVIKSVEDIVSIPYYVYDFEFDDYQDKDAIEEGFVLEGNIPALKNESAFTLPLFAERNPSIKDGIFTQFDGWDMYYKVTAAEAGQDGVIYDEILNEYWCLCPVKMIDSEIAMNNGAGIFLYPRYVDVQYAYSVIDTATGLPVPGFNYTKTNDFANTVNGITGNAGTYIITLYTDIMEKESAGTASISSNSGRIIYFDLNGHDYIRNNDIYNRKGGAFSVGESGELHLYSTKPGGRVFSFTYTYTSAKAPYANGGSLVGMGGSTDAAKAAKVYFGKVDTEVNGIKIKADGNNLWTSSALLVEAGTSIAYYNVYDIDSTTKLPIDKNGDGIIGEADKKDNALIHYNEIHVDGGTYTRPNSDGGGIIKTNAYLLVDVKNALFVGANTFATDSRYNAKITGGADNCVFFAGFTSSIVGQLSEGSELKLTNCTVLGLINATSMNYVSGSYNLVYKSVSDKSGNYLYENNIFKYVGTGGNYVINNIAENALLGKVIIGEGCKLYNDTFTTRAGGKSLVVLDEGIEKVEINESYRENIYWYSPTYTYVDDVNGTFNEASINTKVNKTSTFTLAYGYTAKNDVIDISWITGGNTIETVQRPAIGKVFYGYGFGPSVDTTVATPETDMFKFGISAWLFNNAEFTTSFAIPENGKVDLVGVAGGVVAPDKTKLPPILQYYDIAAKYTGSTYVPHFDAEEVTIDGVVYKISASSWLCNNNALTNLVDYNGKKYYNPSKTYSGAYSLHNGGASFKLTFTVTKVEEGVDPVEYTFSFEYASLGIGDYLIKVFKDAKDVTEENLAANAIRYSLLYYQYQLDFHNGSGINNNQNVKNAYSRLQSFIENNAKYEAAVIDINSNSFNSKVANAAAKTGDMPKALADYISGITFYNNAGTLTLCVVPVKNIKNLEEGDRINLATSMNLKVNYFGSNFADRSLYIDVPNKSSGGDAYVDYYDAKGNLISGQNWSQNTGYYNNVNSHFVVATATSVLTIELKTIEKDGDNYVETPYSFQYTAADYVVAFENSAVEQEARLAEIVKAFLAYGEAAVDYLRVQPE